MASDSYKSKWTRKRRAMAIVLLGSVCVKCGGTDNLEFDHIDPTTKLFNLATGLHSKAWDIVLTELEKCQLLCVDCHKIKTLEYLKKTKRRHGTTNMYTRHKCRCDPCREVWNADKRRRYVLS